MMRLMPILLLSLLTTSRAVLGAPVDIRVVLRGEQGAISIPDLKIQIVEGPAGTEIQKLLPVDSRDVQLDLVQPGVWYLRAIAPGYWGETRALIVPHSGERLDLALWPAATLRGRIAEPTSISRITVQFQSAATGHASEHVVPQDSEACTVAKGIVECLLPAGLLDYSLRSPGFVPIHRWGRTLESREVVDLGKLEFKRGSSLLGRVTAPQNWRMKKGEHIRVDLAPEVLPSNRTGETSRSRIAARSVVPNERGFFLFEGIQPGAYEIFASAPSLVSERRTVNVLEGLQAELRTPLALSKPLTVTMTVEPAVDPWGAPWSVELSRIDLKSVADVHLVDTAKVSETGTWKRDGLTPGDYLVKIQRTRGVWHSQIVHFREDSDVAIRIPLAKVLGELKLGDMPLVGTIWFGGELGEVSIPIRTNSDGSFKAYLPIVEGNVWKEVDIATDSPHVRTTLTDVRLQEPDADGVSKVELILSTNRLFGEVVTEDGKPTSSNATVFASMRGADFSALQVDVDDAGIFSFTGLKPGTYSVYAVGADGKSTATDVEVGDTSAAEMKILLRSDRLLRGEVRSRYGAVVGARVSAYPEDRTGFGIVQWDQTDFDGRFAVAVAPGSQNLTLTVLAPGYAYTLLAVPTIPAEPLSVSVEQDGGRIVADLPAYEKPRQPYLFHGRAFVAFASLEHARVAVKDGSAYVIDHVSPGPYDVCVATPQEALLLASAPSRSGGGCLTGFLARGSVLMLRQPAG